MNNLLFGSLNLAIGFWVEAERETDSYHKFLHKADHAETELWATVQHIVHGDNN